MKIASNLKIDPTEYASQGNAILGIRDSGKTYTATAIAEKLLENGVPFITFDPIGIWRNLKYGKSGPGCKVVVAGENGDLELTRESAPKIVRAAMKENIPLVIDLYSMKLSKADWRHIVQECIQILLYENKTCGLRHIFIEEAAEFCPQRVGPEYGRVYAEIEKLARMGGNASLGYTLINQRAEEVNKAVLELCDCLFLHRQKGRHSLTALGKWLDVADATGSKEIIKSMPKLEQGNCWVWQQGSNEPVLIKVLPKKTVHPDRRNPLKLSKSLQTDVSAFVGKINKLVAQEKPKIPEIAAIEINMNGQTKVYSSNKAAARIIEERKAETMVSQSEVEELKQKLRDEKKNSARLTAIIEDFKKQFAPQYKTLKKVFEKLDDEPIADSSAWTTWLEKLHGKNRDMLQVLIESRSLTRQQIAFKVGMSTNSGSFNTYLSKLKSLGLIKKSGDQIVIVE